MPTLKTVTLGCKVNQYETELLREGFLRLGYREALGGEPADLCVVNTCTVTAQGDAKSRKAIRQLARENPHAEIVVTGCYATRAAKEVARLPGVAEVVVDKGELPNLLARRGLDDMPTGIAGFGSRHRAYVKVQDGCRMKCSYCIIPQVRPRLLSRPLEHVLDEVSRLVTDRGLSQFSRHSGHAAPSNDPSATKMGLSPSGTPASQFSRHSGHAAPSNDPSAAKMGLSPSGTPSGERSGHREIVVTGIHLGHYGVDLPGPAPNLADLVRRLAELPGDFRIRLSSLEAAEVDERLIDLLAAFPHRLCPHLHLSLQSGSDAVLRRMRRRDTAAGFIDRCRRIKDRLDRPAITTDLIVGFPGETDADFAATCRVVEQVGFAKVHVFRFSPREGTPAAAMPGQVPEAVKHRRMTALSAIAGQARRQYLAGLVGRPLQVLVESPLDGQPGRWVGTAERYVPVELTATAKQEGQFVIASPVKAQGDRVIA